MELILVFHLAEELYGLEVSQVQEVVEAPRIDYIPLAPAGFLGAINFHGSILPVLDLVGHLGFAAGERDLRLIVLPPQVSSLGLAVTSLVGIVPLEHDALLPYRQERESAVYIRAAFSHDRGMINLLDVPRLLNSLEHG